MRRAPILISFVMAACSGEPSGPTPDPPAAPPEAPSAPVIPPPPVLRTPGALRESTWMFYDPIGPLGCGLFGGGMSADCDPHFVGDPRTYHAREGHLVREDAGVTVFDVPLDELSGATDLVISLHTELTELRVAGVLEGDVVITRRSSEDGAAIATYRVAHDGTPAQRVQLDSADGRIFVRALAVRPWSALLDANDGTLLDRAEVGVSLAELSPDAPDRTWQSTRPSIIAGDVTVRRGHVRSRGERVWDLDLADPFECGGYALAELDRELAVVHHCPAASSAQLTFVDRADGTVVARSMAGTIGTIGHSMYHADVDLAVARDLLWVRGDESGGTYVCVIEPREHRTIACSIHRR